MVLRRAAAGAAVAVAPTSSPHFPTLAVMGAQWNSFGAQPGVPTIHELPSKLLKGGYIGGYLLEYCRACEGY